MSTGNLKLDAALELNESVKNLDITMNKVLAKLNEIEANTKVTP